MTDDLPLRIQQMLKRIDADTATAAEIRPLLAETDAACDEAALAELALADDLAALPLNSFGNQYARLKAKFDDASRLTNGLQEATSRLQRAFSNVEFSAITNTKG